MGYVHDTASCVLASLSSITVTVGTWAMTQAAHLWTLNHTAAADASLLKVPLPLPQNSAGLKGAYLKSVDVWWINATADLTDCSAEIYRSTLPAQAGTLATVTQPLSYDSGHLNAAARKTQAQHMMTVTLTTPFWVDNNSEAYLELTVNAAATSAYKLQAVRANYTYRV